MFAILNILIPHGLRIAKPVLFRLRNILTCHPTLFNFYNATPSYSVTVKPASGYTAIKEYEII